MKHGTHASYDARCRCQLCVAFLKAYTAERRRRIQAGEEQPPAHNRSGYSLGCRCEVCCAASAIYAKNRRAAVKEGRLIVPHGSLRYSAAGCRCPICCEAQQHERIVDRTSEGRRQRRNQRPADP